MRKVYHFKMLRTAALILIGAPAFGAAGLLLIRLHPGNLPVRIVGYAGIPFIAVITSEPQKPAVQSHNRLRLWLRRLDERLTGSAINISPSSIHCRRDELYATLCEYLEKYGR